MKSDDTCCWKGSWKLELPPSSLPLSWAMAAVSAEVVVVTLGAVVLSLMPESDEDPHAEAIKASAAALTRIQVRPLRFFKGEPSLGVRGMHLTVRTVRKPGVAPAVVG